MFRRQLRMSSVLALLAYPVWDRPFLNRQPPVDPLGSNDDLNLITDKFRTLRDKYDPPKYPIVLCHGLLGFDTMVLLQFPPLQALFGLPDYDGEDLKNMSEQGNSGSVMVNYWFGIEDALRAAGAEVITAKVPAFGSIADRAKLLDTLLAAKCKEYPGRKPGERLKINLVGHLMGGLDSRYLISKLQLKDSPYEVVSLTTVGTPHHGSEVADFVMNLVGHDDKLKAICPTAILQLTSEFLKSFNQDVRNDPAVSYFSYGALMNPSGIKLFRGTYEIIKMEILGRGGTHVENDGMVSVALSKWGNYVGTLDDVDHLDLINWTNRVRTVVDQVLFHSSPGFNAIALYLDIAETLSRNGF